MTDHGIRTEKYSGKQCIAILVGASLVAWVILLGVIFSAIEIGEKYVSAFSSY